MNERFEGKTRTISGAAGAAMLLMGMVLLGPLLPAGHGGQGAARASAPLTDDEILERLRDYLRIDTSNPPGNELKAARFFKSWFDDEGIPTEIFEIAPGRANL